MEESYPYNLPIWRSSYQATSPDGRLVAEIAQARETSMGNPTSGILQLPDGRSIPNYSPSFLWSDDSRYLSVPQWRYVLGLQVRQRILVVDTRDQCLFASRPLGWWLQPISFERGTLAVEANPTRRSRRVIVYRIPADLATFSRLRGQ